MKESHSLILSLFTLTTFYSISAMATEGDVFQRGTEYNTVTYTSPPHFSKCGGEPIDINFKKDDGAPLYAPEDGVVVELEYQKGGFGNNIYWISNSGEKLFLAHLKQIEKTGTVYGGQKIGELGNSGSPWGAFGNNPHLHIERCGGELELSGKTVKATTKQGGAGVYRSIGQIKKFFCVSEPARTLFVEQDYSISWYPPNVPCVEAKEWMENTKCVFDVYAISYDKKICESAFNILAKRSWRLDGTYDGWYKIFFEEFDFSNFQCKAR